MWPDEGSSYLLCFVTQSPTVIFSSPVWLLCSYCCQQICFPFSFLMNISIQSIFCIFIVPPQTCGLSSIDIESICRSQQSVQTAAPSHATPSMRRCRFSRSHPTTAACCVSNSIPCPAPGPGSLLHIVQIVQLPPSLPFNAPSATGLRRASLCFPFRKYLSFTWWPRLPAA